MPTSQTTVNVRQAVPLYIVSDMERSLRFYLEGLGFTMRNKWVPQDRIEWCWLEIGHAAIMLQQSRKETVPGAAAPGEGVSLNFVCNDALQLYREFLSRGIIAKEPFVGNNMWVVPLVDPDGYQLYFESDTDVAEGKTYPDWIKETENL